MSGMLGPLLAALVPLIGAATLYLGLPVLAPLLTAAAGVSPEAYGWIGGAIGVGSVWFYVANHTITLPLGPVHTLLLGGVILAAGAGLMLTAVWPLMLLGGVLIGFGYATSTPAGSQILADHAPRTAWATLFSIRQAGVPMGGVIAGTLGAWVSTRYGWRPAVVVIVLVMAVLVSLLVFAPRAFNESRPRPPFRLLPIFDIRNVRRPFRAVWEIDGLMRIAIACAGFAVVQGATFAFFVTYLNTDLGYGLAEAGSLFAVMQISSVAGRVILGAVADRVGSPRPVMKALAVLSAASVLLLATLSPGLPPYVTVPIAAFVGFSIATWNGLYLAEVAILAPKDAVSEATAATTFFVFFTYMVIPPLFGLAARSFGYPAAFAVTAAGAVVSGVTLMLALRPRARRADEISQRREKDAV
jgi:MFS family permease